MSNEQKIIELVANKGIVSVAEILNNLKVLKTEHTEVSTVYVITRENKDMPWPAPYQAGREIDGRPYHCCSYSTLDEEEWPEDTKQLNVYTYDDEN